MLFYTLGKIKLVIKVNFTCVFFTFLNAATGNFKTSHVDGKVFPLDTAGLEKLSDPTSRHQHLKGP